MSRATIVIRLSKQSYLVCAGILWLAGLSFGQATISLSPSGGPPTTSVLVSGGGFSPNAAIGIYFDTTHEASAIADGSGSFSKISISVLGSALPGQHRIAAGQRSSGASARAAFEVNTNWSQFLFGYPAGKVPPDNRVNPYENVLSARNASGLNLKWNFATSDAVAFSPAVANGVVYVGSDDNNVYALNASTGAKLWSFPTSGSVFSTPAVANGVVYVGSWSGPCGNSVFYALNASTGALLWSFPTGSCEAPYSATVVSGVVYVSYGTSVNALDASTGTVLWSFTGSNIVQSAPTVVNGVVYLGCIPVDSEVFALDASTGAKLWSFTTVGGVISSPAVANGAVYVGDDSGNVYALNASTGAKLWSLATRGAFFSSPAVANGVVYLGSYDDNVYALNASTGAKLWTFATSGTINSSPAVANGVVYIGSDDDNVYALDASTGAKLWSFATGGGVDSSPAVANGVVYVGSDDNNVYAFDLTGGYGPVEEPQP
jgi:outer membrane protein assembly factor BamB